MAVRITVGGVERADQIALSPSVNISLLQNGRSRMQFSCEIGYSPARFEEVIAYDKSGVIPIYGGIILQRIVGAFVEGEVSDSQTKVEVVGFESYLDWVYVDLQYLNNTTLQVVLDDIIDELPVGYGITLDTANYTGDTLAPFTWTTMRVSDGLRELCDRTGRIYRVSPLKVLSVPLPGGESAPVSITDSSPNCKELSWQDPVDPAVTTVKLVCGSNIQQNFTYRINTDGVTRSWVIPGPPAVPNGAFWWTVWVVKDGNILGDGSDNYFFLLAERVDSGAPSWQCLWVEGTLTFSIDADFSWVSEHGAVFTNGVCSDGWYLDFTYLAQYPFTVTATTGGSPEVQIANTRNDVFSIEQAQEIADGMLASIGASPRTADINTLVDGWAPGQSLVVDMTSRAIDATFAVTQVDIELIEKDYWQYNVSATELSVFPGTYLDQWRALLAGSSSGSGSIGTSSGVVATGSGGVSTIYLGGSRFHAVQVPA